MRAIVCRLVAALQTILENSAVLDDQFKVLLRIFDELDVGDPIAIDHKQVGECALFDYPSLPG
jgi:hypothetical protein